MARFRLTLVGKNVPRRSSRRVPSLGRHRPSLEPRKRFLLFCEGKNTEPGYFEAIKRAFASTLLDIQSVPAAGVPFTIAEKATEYVRSRRRRRKHSFEKDDEVWAVFDRDEHNRFEEAVLLCRNGGVRVARSNPCFELWLILHEREFDAVIDRYQMQKELARIRTDYDKDGSKRLDFDELVARVHEAEERANKQLARRKEERIPYNNPSTTVGMLTAAVRDAHANSR